MLWAFRHTKFLNSASDACTLVLLFRMTSSGNSSLKAFPYRIRGQTSNLEVYFFQNSLKLRCLPLIHLWTKRIVNLIMYTTCVTKWSAPSYLKKIMMKSKICLTYSFFYLLNNTRFRTTFRSYSQLFSFYIWVRN